MKNSQNAVQHNAGPWSSISHNWHETSVYAASGLRVCKLDTEDWGVTEETEDEFGQKQEANARLIAAAPDLLVALQFLLTASGEQLTTAFEQAQEAVAKATRE